MWYILGMMWITSDFTISAFCPYSLSAPKGTHLSAKRKEKEITIKELMERMKKNPAAFQQEGTKKKKARTRKRVENPKQEYMYASQRKAKGYVKEKDSDQVQTPVATDTDSPIQQARRCGLVNAATQHCDALIDNVEPEILGQIRVGDETATSGTTAYIINKPAGWSILGGATKKKVSPGSSSAFNPREAVVKTEVKDEQHQEYTTRIKVKDEDGLVDFLDFNENDVLAALTPEERAEFEAEGGLDEVLDAGPAPKPKASIPQVSSVASFDSPLRPSVVSWLKDLKAAQGTPIRGGKYWKAVAGATDVDDTGLVVLCPKDKTDKVYIDYAKYVAVVGNGKHFTPKAKTKEAEVPKELTKMEMLSKVRKGRGGDTVLNVALTFVEQFSSCTSVVQPCQAQFADGIRGDPNANPLDRRAPRRLIHCDSISVSSLSHDESVQLETDGMPGDIGVLADRRNHHEYSSGSFLGRSELKENPLTNAYREMNGEADGFPGWTVDRYGKWLLVQHNEKAPRGPLPSIHDGNTAGVYYLPSNSNRSAMGSKTDIRPILLEGQAAPGVLPVLENGITYHVSLEKDLSTGIFLDQRPQRAWLARNCNENTRVLNCFAHCGAFSVAAAVAGASTVSLDLNKKWLDRIEPQMVANNVAFDKHDCIYGDCKSRC